MRYQGHVANGVIVLDDDATLPEGMLVRIEPIAPAPDATNPARPRTLAEKFQNVTGKATSLPADMAAQHDHYIHGSPKR